MKKSLLAAAAAFSMLSALTTVAADNGANISLRAMGDLVLTYRLSSPDARLTSFFQILQQEPAALNLMISGLNQDLAERPFEQEHLTQLQQLLARDPGNIRLAEITLRYMLRNNPADEAITSLLVSTAEKLNIAGAERSEIQPMISWLDQTLLQLLCADRIDDCEKLIDHHLTNAGKNKFYVLLSAANFSLRAIYRKHYTSPVFPSWEKLPEHGWKLRYRQLLDGIAACEPYLDLDENYVLLSFYSSRKAPRCQEFIASFIENFCPQNLRQHQMLSALLYTKDLANYRKLKKYLAPHTSELLLLLQTKEFEAAEKFISGLAPAVNDQFNLALEVSRENWPKAAALCRKLKNKRIYFSMIIHFMLQCALHEKSPELWQIARSCAARFPDSPSTSNALGYTAALLNIHLPEAEKMLNFALTAEPDNPAYLDSMAYILYRQKRYAESRKYIQKALSKCEFLYPGAAMLLHAAEIELAIGNNRKLAADYLNLALQLAADDPLEFDAARAAELKELLK